MNILMLNNYHYLRGGSERVLFAEKELLTEKGHKVEVLSRRHEGDLSSDHYDLFPRDFSLNVRFSIDALRTAAKMFYAIDTKRAISALLKRFRPDIVHAHNIHGRLTSSVLDVLHREKIPVVMTLHDYKLVCPSYLFLNRGQVCEACKGGKFHMAFQKRCVKNSYAASAVYACEAYFNKISGKYARAISTFISPSLFHLSKLREYGIPHHKTVNIRNFLPASSFAPEESAGRYLLCFGRLSREKGLSTLIRAFARLDIDGVELHLVGDGPDRQDYERQAAQIPGIVFRGFLSGEPLSAAIKNARAVVFPSECYENAPMAILEAFAYGKPVVGSRLGGIPEMVDEDTTGFLFEPGNVEDLTNKLRAILGLSDSEILDMGRAARQRVENNYNEEVHYERLMAVYEKAIKDGSNHNHSVQN